MVPVIVQFAVLMLRERINDWRRQQFGSVGLIPVLPTLFDRNLAFNLVANLQVRNR